MLVTPQSFSEEGLPRNRIKIVLPMELIDTMKFKLTGKTGQENISKKISGSYTSKAPSSSSAYEKISRFHPGTSIHGNFTSSDNLYFSGTLIGDIKLDKKLVLGEKSNIKGNISALNLIILGKVEGDINTQGKVIFGSKSTFKGKISAETIEVREGAIFNAQCIVISSDSAWEETLQQSQTDIDLEQESLIESGASEKEENAFFFKIFQNQ
jgi:cytoskeletal protein CcmA (bactofilin family)